MKLILKLPILAFFLASIGFSQTPIINKPSVSPDGQKLAFNYQGDIWTATINGENIKRLTVHEGYDTNPLWSHDGHSIAFQSNRYGNNDIFIMPSQGGLPERITFHSAYDYLTDYTSDGFILFSTRRAFTQVEREYETQRVHEKGGTPERYLNAVGFDAKQSPNGKFIVFVKGTCRIEREAYKGPANKNIWLYDIENDSYTQLTTYEGNDFYPQWGDNSTIYFQSSRTGKYNIHKLTINQQGQKTGLIEPITTFKDMGIFSFNISADGNTMVAVTGDKLYKIDAKSRSQNEIHLKLASDFRFDPVVHKTYTKNISDIAISPNGKYSALVIRGELFIRSTKKDNKKTVNISKSAYRDRMPTWLNDSTLIFVSDRGGQNDLYLLRSDDANESSLLNSLKLEVVQLTKTPDNESNPVISPDKKSMAYRSGRGKLMVSQIDQDGTLSKKTTLLDGWATPSDVVWSPDSKWLAYSLQDLDFNSEIYIHKADNSKKPVNVSRHPKQDSSPIWSADGKKLVFSSNRNNGDYDVWFVWLNKSDWQKTTQDWEEEKNNEGEKDNKKEGEKQDKKKNGSKPVKDITIDFDDIYQRQVQVTNFVGGEFAQYISKDGKTIYYTTGNGSRGDAKVESDLFKISWDGKDKKEITKKNKKPSRITVDDKGNTLFMTLDGALSRVDLSNDKLDNLVILAKMDINYAKESNQIFEEAWKAINDGFYDPNFHGQNWSALKKTYKPLAMRASTRIDFKNIFNWMLGQINASHMGLYGGEQREGLQKESTGLLGVEFMPKSTGGLEVSRVTYGMPANRVASTIQVGDVVTAVNGAKLSKDLNVYSLLEGTANEKIYLDVKRDNKTLEVVVRPQSSNRKENYNAWVKERKRLTEQYSNGELGYIHIQGMNWQSFEEFERELTSAGLGKKGLVIDVRYNGGGWTTDYLMAVLNVKQHAYTVPRGAVENLEREQTKFVNHYPFSERLPLAVWTKPSIALCNSASYSNAEIFSHAYKTLGIGTLVGEPTFGAVISTGATQLIDGSYVRMPFRGWFVKPTKSNMELGPAIPDVLVTNNPDEKEKGKDSQLKKAVNTLMEQL